MVNPASGQLTSDDPEPPFGTEVVDYQGQTWKRTDDSGGSDWMLRGDDDDPESWRKVAGNYGPVTIKSAGR